MTENNKDFEEQRTSPRKEMSLWATARGAGGLLEIRCMVADASSEGCQIVTRRVPELPDKFTLDFDGFSKSYRCQVAWRSPWAAGVRFL